MEKSRYTNQTGNSAFFAPAAVWAGKYYRKKSGLSVLVNGVTAKYIQGGKRMNQVTQAEVTANYMQTSNTQASDKTNTKKTKVGGAVIGTPELSDKAKKYYEQLKKKYSNMDFILVSKDKKAEAQANAGRYANANRMVVLIDEEKIERMAVDEEYRKKYEAIIGGAKNQLSQLKDSLGANASGVKTYGMQVNDGGNASFFAVIDKSMAAQRARIDKKAAERKAQEKEDRKAAAQKRAEKRKSEKEKEADRMDWDEEDVVTVTASSVEELIQKINQTISMGMSDYVRTEQESWVGGHLDFYG